MDKNLYALYMGFFFLFLVIIFSWTWAECHYNNKLLFFIIYMFARSNYGLLVLREKMTALLSSAVVLVLSNSTYETNFFFAKL